jgi:hypothetical protein
LTDPQQECQRGFQRQKLFLQWGKYRQQFPTLAFINLLRNIAPQALLDY